VPYLTTVLIDPPVSYTEITHLHLHLLWSPHAFVTSPRPVHPATKFVVTGHEVVGKVVEVGSKVTQFKVGQRVAVGAQVGSCHECKACKSGLGEWSLRRCPSVALWLSALALEA
jgi:threonine dehydrogenase-like Zn-dependent dehydrogenase